jgi:uncharacterized protein (TIGR01777 family)
VSGGRLLVGVTGASGLVGRALVARLRAGGHEARALPRLPGEDTLRGLDAVAHLAGETISGFRWTDEKKRRIRDSRVDGTAHLASILAALEEDERPRSLVCASGVAVYGESFLADVVRAWEAAAAPAERAGVRVVFARLGVVLSGEGGALPRMALPFRLGVGGSLGDPSSWLPWISIDDAAAAFELLLRADDARGVVDVVAGSVTLGELAREIGAALNRPSWLRVPRLALDVALGGEQAAGVLESLKVEPSRLPELGLDYQHPTITAALRSALGE